MSSEDLRKKVLGGAAGSSGPTGTNNTNGSSSQLSSPLMSKTSSVVNLTKSELYSLYDEDPFSNLSTDDIELPNKPELKDNDVEVENLAVQSGQHNPHRFNPVLFIGKLAIVTVASFAYNKFTQTIHMLQINQGGNQVKPILFLNLFLSRFAYNLRPFQYFESLQNPEDLLHIVDLILAYLIQGLGMSVLHPVMDVVLPKKFSERLLSLAPQLSRKELQRSNLISDLLRLFVTFLGILYAVRRIEWASAVQLLILWSLLNPCLWLLLDGTISGFLLSTVAAIGSIGIVYTHN